MPGTATLHHLSYTSNFLTHLLNNKKIGKITPVHLSLSLWLTTKCEAFLTCVSVCLSIVCLSHLIAALFPDTTDQRWQRKRLTQELSENWLLPALNCNWLKTFYILSLLKCIRKTLASLFLLIKKAVAAARALAFLWQTWSASSVAAAKRRLTFNLIKKCR